MTQISNNGWKTFSFQYLAPDNHLQGETMSLVTYRMENMPPFPALCQKFIKACRPPPTKYPKPLSKPFAAPSDTQKFLLFTASLILVSMSALTCWVASPGAIQE